VVWSINFLLVLASLSLVGSALGAALFGERSGWFEVAGIGLTLIGIALANRRSLDNDMAKARAPRGSSWSLTYRAAGLSVKTLKRGASAYQPNLSVGVRLSPCACRV
jgi:drug/metabolite transporter (DMT)-like permease